MSSPEQFIPDEAREHLEQITNPQHLELITERLGDIAMFSGDQIPTPQQHSTRYETTAEEPIPYGRTELTDGLISSIAQRGKNASIELSGSSDQEETGRGLWETILDSEMSDIKAAHETGDADKLEGLILEHMVTLELSQPNIGPTFQEATKKERARQSMLKLADMGLAETVIDISRRSQGLVVAAPVTEYSDFGRSKTSDTKHDIQSVGHIFDDAIKPIEVGLGSKISFDPEEEAITPTEIKTEDIDRLDTLGTAIAVSVRSTKKQETESADEDQALIESLTCRGLASLRDGSKVSTLGVSSSAESDALALKTLAKYVPELSTSPKYEHEFANIRLARLVDSNYRINYRFTARLDADIVTLVAQGDYQLASRMVTISDDEIVHNGSDGVLIWAMKNNLHDQYTEDQQAEIVEHLNTIRVQKAEAFKVKSEAVFGHLDLPDNLKNIVITTVNKSHDPESALDAIVAIQAAAGDSVPPELFQKVIGQLVRDRGWNDSSVLDEMSHQSELLAPLFFREDFQKGMDDPDYGILIRNSILERPDLAEQTLGIVSQLKAHPAMAPLLEVGSTTNSLMYDAIVDPELRQEILSRLDEVLPYIANLDANQIKNIVGGFSEIAFIRRITTSDKESGLFTKLDDANKKMVLAVGLSSQEDIQGLIVRNTGLLEHAQPTLDLLNQAKLLPEADLIIKRSLLTAEDFQTRSQELYKAFSETQLLELIGNNGSAYSFGSLITNLVINSDKPYETAQQACEQLLGNDPLWLRCFKISRLGVGAIESVGYQKGLIIKDIPMSLPIPSLSHDQQLDVITNEKPKSFTELTIEVKRLVANLGDMSDEEVQTLNSIPFTQLTPEYQEAILAYRLFETITLSRDKSKQQEASSRNEVVATTQNWLKPGDLVHATDSPISLRAILSSGAMAGETLGFKGRADSYPYNLDTVTVTSAVNSKETFDEKLKTLNNGRFGGIAIVFGRGPSALHDGEEFPGGMSEDHRLVIGGLPSTEISTIIIRSAATAESLDTIKKIVVESGIYIPVVDSEGKLVLSYDDYQRIQEDNNIDRVRPEIVDGAFERANSQAGSNDGAEFIVPQGDGKPPQRWYVKFSDTDPDRLWTEILADKFYGAVVPDVVPETKPVVIEGRLARASIMVETESNGVTNEARDEAFVMDCLLGNWDAVYNSANIVMSNGHGMRIDTGNSFDYRAQGDKKPDGTFTETVYEIGEGSDDKDLGRGMRQMYPGITDEQIKGQVATMREKLTDEVIDELVDSVRRSSADRAKLKSLIKARRDYIISRFS